MTEQGKPKLPPGTSWAPPGSEHSGQEGDSSTATDRKLKPSPIGAFIGGLLWGPLGVILAAVRANHPSTDERDQEEIMSGAWIGALISTGLIVWFVVVQIQEAAEAARIDSLLRGLR